jgi:TRAP-type C4-dicarboxylate transport system substrate-binding protein
VPSSWAAILAPGHREGIADSHDAVGAESVVSLAAPAQRRDQDRLISHDGRAAMSVRLRRFAALGLAGALLASCGKTSSGTPAPGAQAGVRPGPVAITVADWEPAGRPSNLPLGEFKSRVEKLSSGSMSVRIRTEADASDRAVIDKVRNGEFQLAVVAARAWSDVGVTSLKALQAPFLIESSEHAAVVAADEELTADLLSGLESVDVTGLVIFPETPRHFFSFSDPIVRPSDLAGLTVRSVGSAETNGLFDALGARAIDNEGDAFRQGIAEGTIGAVDWGFISTLDPAVSRTTATGNVTPYTKFNTLVVNSKFWSDLDNGRRSIISAAAAAMRTWSLKDTRSDPEAAHAFCKAGGRVVLAEPDQVVAFRSATEALSRRLAADAATATRIAAIDRLGAEVTASAVEPCDPVITKSSIQPDGGELPNGVYRAELTDDYLVAQGVTNPQNNNGIWTWRFDDGHWTMDQAGDVEDHLKGIYRAVGSALHLRWDPLNDPAVPLLGMSWSANAHGDLTFEALPGEELDWAFGVPFVRVGDLPN